MNVTNIAATVLILVAIALVIYFMKSASNKRAIKEEDERIVELNRALRANRNRFLKLLANDGRITVQITHHQIEWLEVQHPNTRSTYTSLQQIKQAEELDPEEVLELDMYEALLREVRRHKDSDLVQMPDGCIKHVYPSITVIQYISGNIKVGTRNMMRVVMGHNPDHTMYISAVQVSVDFTHHKPEIFDWQDKRFRALFKKKYGVRGDHPEIFEQEIVLLDEIRENIKKFNDHVTWFVFDTNAKGVTPRIIGFCPPADSLADLDIDGEDDANESLKIQAPKTTPQP